MHTIEVLGREEILIEVPEHWNDMTPDQVSHVLGLYDQLSAARCTVEEFKLGVLFYFVPTRISSRTVALSRRGLAWEFVESALCLYEQLFGYMLSTDGHSVSLHYDSPVQFFPSLGGSTGPGTLLSGLTFGRFVESCALLQRSDADQMGLVYELYPGAKSRQLRRWQAAWVYMWFRSCVVHIQTLPVEIDGREVDFSPLFASGGGSTSSGPIDPWRGVAFSLAENGLFGDMDSLRDAELYDVLMYLLKSHYDVKNSKH